MNSLNELLINKKDTKSTDTAIDAINQLMRQTIQMKLILNKNIQKCHPKTLGYPSTK